VKKGRNGRRKAVRNRVAVDWMDLRCEDLNITRWKATETIPREEGINLENCIQVLEYTLINAPSSPCFAFAFPSIARRVTAFSLCWFEPAHTVNNFAGKGAVFVG